MNRKDMFLKDLKELTWDSKAQWAFHYYKKTSNDWKDTSYNVDWKWEDWNQWWSLTMSWVNEEWKEFSYSWTIHDWKSEWILTNEDWNSKSLELNQLDLKEIYNDSNNL